MKTSLTQNLTSDQKQLPNNPSGERKHLHVTPNTFQKQVTPSRLASLSYYRDLEEYNWSVPAREAAGDAVQAQDVVFPWDRAFFWY